ncbi:MAG: FHA domain-containing protein, partial [Chloroflexota bacterium]
MVRTEAQGETERIKLRSFPLLIGSGDTCHLTLHYDAIVTTHLRVLVTYSGHVLLSNLGGAGTAIMEAKPIPVYVPIYWKPGQMIKLGPVELQLQMVIVDSSDTGDREKIQSVVITREINRVRDDTETRIPSSSNSSLPSSSQDETTTMPEPDTTADNSTDPQDKAGMHAPASEESPAEGENGAQPDPSVTAAAMDSQSKSDTAINRASVVITESDETPDNRVKPEPEDEREPKNDDTSGAYLDELFKGMVVNVSDIIGTDETSSEQQIATTQSGVANHLDVQSVPSTRLQSEITTTASFNNTGMIHPSTGVSLPKNWNHTATFAVSWSQRSLRLVMGQPVRLTIAVAGLTAQRTRVHLAIAGVPRDCIQLASNTFDLKPGHIETIIMILNVPRETAPLPERLVLRLYDEMNPAVASHCAVQLNFRTLPNLTGFIEPETG